MTTTPSSWAAFAGDVRGDNEGYPVRLTGLRGGILQPLCLRYADRLIHDNRIRPMFTDCK